MQKFVTLRGTHGAGKSTVIRTILSNYPCQQVGPDRKPEGYFVTLPGQDRRLFVLGPYNEGRYAGGADAIQPYALIIPKLMEKFEGGYHILAEGAIISSSYGNLGRATEPLGDSKVFAFLMPSVEQCLAQLNGRRVAQGKDTEANPKIPTEKHANVARSIKVIQGMGRQTVILDPDKAVNQLLAVYGVKTSKKFALATPTTKLKVQP